MSRELTPKQEAFCVKYFEGGTATQAARDAGYRGKSVANRGWRNLAKPHIAARIKALRQRVEDDTVMRVLDRKRKLSEIARGCVTDYLNDRGDGFVFDADSVNPGAVEHVNNRTIMGADGEAAEVISEIRLRDPIRAIAELNKMERIYGEQPQTTPHIWNIVVGSQQAKELTERVIKGERLIDRGQGDTSAPLSP